MGIETPSLKSPILLSHRAVIHVRGLDAERFLQGLITQNMREVTSDHWHYSCMLTPQGKFLWDLFLKRNEQDSDQFILDTVRATETECVKKLRQYVLRSQVIVQPDAQACVQFAFEPQPGFFADTRHPHLGFRGVVPISDQLTGNEAHYHHHRVQLGVPEGGIDVLMEQHFPLHFQLDAFHAISFTKGCYVGQEVTARMHHRAELRKALYRLTLLAGEWPSAPGQPLFRQGQKIGLLYSHADRYALAVLEQQSVLADVPQIIHTVGGSEVKVTIHPAIVENNATLQAH